MSRYKLVNGVHAGTAAHWAAERALDSGSYGRDSRQPEIITARVRVKAAVGYSKRGKLLHRVAGADACATWAPMFDYPRVLARWKCGGFASNAAFGEPTAELGLCRACDFAGTQADGVAVYFAERDGLIKIGCSSNVLRRVAGLKASLLAIQSGGFGLEADLHSMFEESRAHGEWFRPTPDLLAYIASLKAAA